MEDCIQNKELRLKDLTEEVKIGEKNEMAGCNCTACAIGLLCAACAGCLGCIFPPALAGATLISGSTAFSGTLGLATAAAVSAAM